MKKIIAFLLFSNCFITNSFGQRNVNDSIIGTPWVSVNYGGNWTSGDMALKYDFLHHLGIMAGYKTTKNWFLGIDANFMFSERVHTNGMLNNLQDSQGNVTDMNGDIGKIVISARGLNANLAVGKVFPVLSPNENSGIFIHCGFGFLAHKYRIATQDQVIPQLELDYKKGYDRLTLGPNFHQFVGYAFMADHGLINFFGGFYAQQGFTHNFRTQFFDQPGVPVSNKTMLDFQVGFKIGWFIPIYKRKPKDYYLD